MRQTPHPWAMTSLAIPPRSSARHGEWALALIAIACLQGLLLLQTLR